MKSRFSSLLTLLFSGALLAMFALTACNKAEEADGDMAENQQTEEQAAADMEQPAEESSNRGSTSAEYGEATISVDYGRPKWGDTDRLAQATEGMRWRMGMNEATEIKTNADLTFGETVVPAGHYSLIMQKVADGQWQLVFNEKVGHWGSPVPTEGDVASVPMTMTESEEHVETFTIELTKDGDTDGAIVVKWGKYVVSAAFSAA